VPEVSGNHDVYLRFKGEGTGNLMQLKSFRFSGAPKSTSSRNLWLNEREITIYPNPVDEIVNISIPGADDEMLHATILNSQGIQVFQVELFLQNGLISFSLPPGLPDGLIFLSLRSEKTNQVNTAKLIRQSKR
jgi:hypothetical protein